MQWEEARIVPSGDDGQFQLQFWDKNVLLWHCECPGELLERLRKREPHLKQARLAHALRYKQSFASGDEWRTTQMLYTLADDDTKRERYDGKALEMVEREFERFPERQDDSERWIGRGELCDQEGCQARATVSYRMRKATRKRENVWCGETYDPYSDDKRPLVRRFCAAHSRRGDHAIDDCDDNYTLLEGVVQEPEQALRSRSAICYVYAK